MKEKNKEKLLSKRVFNMAMCELIRKTEQEKRYGTSANYRAAFLCFSRFLQEEKKLFVLSKELLSEYEYWLRGRGILWNSISFYMRNLRAMCRCLSDRGVSLPADLFGRVYTGVDKTKKRALSEDVMSRIRYANLEAYPDLAYSRDLFLFSFYCRGMAFVDLAFLTKQNIQGERICYMRRKTGQMLEVALEPCMKEIIQRYPGVNEYLFPLVRTSVPVEAYRQYRVAISIFNRNLKKLALLLDIPPLSSYMSRHSWATIAHNRNVPLSLISESMGHSSEKITRIYLASFNQDLIDEVNRSVISF